MKNHKSILIIFVLFVLVTTAVFADYTVTVKIKDAWTEVIPAWDEIVTKTEWKNGSIVVMMKMLLI